LNYLNSPDLDLILALRRLGGVASAREVGRLVHLEPHIVGARLGRWRNEYVLVKHQDCAHANIYTLINANKLPNRKHRQVWLKKWKRKLDYDANVLEHTLKRQGLLGKNLVNPTLNDKLKEDLKLFG